MRLAPADHPVDGVEFFLPDQQIAVFVDNAVQQSLFLRMAHEVKFRVFRPVGFRFLRCFRFLSWFRFRCFRCRGQFVRLLRIVNELRRFRFIQRVPDLSEDIDRIFQQGQEMPDPDIRYHIIVFDILRFQKRVVSFILGPEILF